MHDTLRVDRDDLLAFSFVVEYLKDAGDSFVKDAVYMETRD